MLLLSPINASLPSSFHRGILSRRPIKTSRRIIAKAKDNTESGGFLENAAIAGGLVSTPVIGWSLYTLKTTGCGLPPGPAGSIGALEDKTGSGLPNGPFGLLGAVEGLSYLSLLAILVVFGLQFLDNGSVPGPLPSDQCFVNQSLSRLSPSVITEHILFQFMTGHLL
ncbi:hypothetical protein Bca52824_034065 [Brassica carinata]|uniref:Uncharacterized protein n=1 Tax=Brassica carinata TaxID=52824 RepID=A0A8X7V7M7_BRACI|nr:hypothetical protein Bca52824_034065 [Brassica carinata]